MRRGLTIVGVLAGFICVLALPEEVWAASTFKIELGSEAPGEINASLKMIAILTLLTLAPSILLTTTSFVRIVCVLSLLRTALGTQTTPPQQVVMGLALFLSLAIMWPIGESMYETAAVPYMEGEISGQEAFVVGIVPLRKFMLRQTRQADLELFYGISQTARPNRASDVGMHLLVPAFIISELRTAFEMGFMVFIPFLMLDMVVASLTMSLGLVMLPPALISMPLKLMLFVLADGWNLLIGSLVRSFG